MKEYELIWEIFNKCPRNQMRDVLWKSWNLRIRKNISEINSKEKKFPMKNCPGGWNHYFDITTSQIKQRCSFTEI